MPPLLFDAWQRELLEVMRLDYSDLFGERSPEGKIQPAEIDETVFRSYYEKGLSPIEAIERAIAESAPARSKRKK